MSLDDDAVYELEEALADCRGLVDELQRSIREGENPRSPIRWSDRPDIDWCVVHDAWHRLDHFGAHKGCRQANPGAALTDSEAR